MADLTASGFDEVIQSHFRAAETRSFQRHEALFHCNFHHTNQIMNELKEKLMALGLSEEMTDKVIVTVAEFVKSKIPSSYHSMIDDVLAGKSPELGGILGSLGGLFGK